MICQTMFIHQHLTRRLPGSCAFTRTLSTATSVNCLGVVGAGQMGSGIACVAALNANIPKVLLMDSNKTQLSNGFNYIDTFLKKQVDKGTISATVRESCLSRIVPTQNLEDFGTTDFVIEAVSESTELKSSIFKALDSCTPKHAVLASNTSSISITKLGASTRRPDQIIGMHFMNPVPIMTLVEVIPSLLTSSTTLSTTQALVTGMGKTSTMSRDVPGFIANRVLMPYINEAIYVLQSQIATRDDIDKTMVLGTGVPKGPLKLADFIGLDTCLAIMNVLHSELGQDKYHPCPLLKTYVDAGFLGKKVGRGFYEYE